MGMNSSNCGALIGKKRKVGLLKDSGSRVGRVLKQNRIKDADNSTRQRKLVPKVPKATDQLTS